MKHRLAWLLAAVVVTAGASVALSGSRFAHSSVDPDGSGGSGKRATPARTTTLILTLAIDATGARVLQATRKPALDFTMPRGGSDLPLQWTMHDDAGEVIAAGGFDPSRICLDPTHAGQPPHALGDLAIPHLSHVNLKVPDLAAFDSIHFTWQTGSDAKPFGNLSRHSIELR